MNDSPMTRAGALIATAIALHLVPGHGYAAPSARPAAARTKGPPAPRLLTDEGGARLIVDGRPFLILGGELGNSGASTLASAKPALAKLGAMNGNTVLLPVSWELVEPSEGQFSFHLIGQLLAEARSRKLRVILLWFGSWKNGMSSYVPAWVKADQRRFPRAEVKGGRGVEALSVFAETNRDADARAFAALMRHVRAIDERHRTVIMVQVENEVAMIDEAADRGAAAAAAFLAGPPAELVQRLTANRSNLEPWLAAAWKKKGFIGSGSWEEIFGKGPATEELFMAWHYARYVDAVTRAGKAGYALPMFVNAALNRPGKRPGEYPSAGPLPHLFDVWKAGAPSIELLAPDIYLPDFAAWCTAYARPGNPLFIPEARNEVDAAVNAFFAVGQGAIGFSPFAIESAGPAAATALTDAYAILGQVAPMLDANRASGGDGSRSTAGVLVTKDQPTAKVVVGDYVLSARHDYTWQWSSPARAENTWPTAGGMVVALARDEFIVAGNGIIVTFEPQPATRGDPGDPIVGIDRIDEGRIANGRFIVTRRLNGDETHQGRHLRLPLGAAGVQRVKLYRYR